MINKLKKMDVGILTLMVCFMIISAMLLYSVGNADPEYANNYKKTIVFYAAGFVLVMIVSLIDYRIFLEVLVLFLWYWPRSSDGCVFSGVQSQRRYRLVPASRRISRSSRQKR